MERSRNLVLTEQEHRALLAMLDVACKGGGLSVAETCIVLAKKIQAAEATTADGAAQAD